MGREQRKNTHLYTHPQTFNDGTNDEKFIIILLRLSFIIGNQIQKLLHVEFSPNIVQFRVYSLYIILL